MNKFKNIKIPNGYEPLGRVYSLAIDHATRQKGADRHGTDRAGKILDFKDQPSICITRVRGLGYPLGQADKKTIEAELLLGRGGHAKAVKELLGAMNYIAFAINDILRDENG